MGKNRGLHILFGLTLTALFALAAWWIIFFNQAVVMERRMKIAELEIEALRRASELRSAATPPPAGPLENEARLEVVRRAEEPERAFPCVPFHPHLFLCPTRATTAEIDKRLQSRRVMVIGESALLLALLLVCTFMLYRMVAQERAGSAKMERFVSAVTHEMKTPLAGLKSMLQTFLADRVPKNRREELYAKGLRELERLEHSVENMLLAGQLRTRRYQRENTPLDVSGLLRRFHGHRLLYTTGGETRLELELPAAEPLMALGDEKAVGTILDNLTDNAIKYGGNPPRVTIEARARHDRVLVSVIDNGIGFEAKDASELFVPFGRLAEAEATSLHGTGLGLSISQALAGHMGGRLVAASEGPGRGSRFTLELKAV